MCFGDQVNFNTCFNMFSIVFFRRKNKYRLFAGLWFGEEKPFFSTFFKPFVDTLQETEIDGMIHYKLY